MSNGLSPEEIIRRQTLRYVDSWQVGDGPKTLATAILAALNESSYEVALRTLCGGTEAAMSDVDALIERAEAIEREENNWSKLGNKLGIFPELVAALKITQAENQRLRQELPSASCGEIDDGHGNVWALCKPNCQMQIVRPGKVQCECDSADD